MFKQWIEAMDQRFYMIKTTSEHWSRRKVGWIWSSSQIRSGYNLTFLQSWESFNKKLLGLSSILFHRFHLRKLQAAKIHGLNCHGFLHFMSFRCECWALYWLYKHLQTTCKRACLPWALRHGFKLVYFPSRKGPNGEPPVNISAWWLPAASRPGDSSPRIVALHGLASNNNHCGF